MSILNSDKLARQSSVSGETKVMIAIQTKFAFGRRATLTLFGGLLLLLSACDALVPPITIQNSTSNDISVSFFIRIMDRFMILAHKETTFSAHHWVFLQGKAPRS